MAWTRGQNSPAFGIQLKPSFVSDRMRKFFGISIEREIIKYNKGKHLNDFKENLKLWSYGSFEDLSRYIGLKVQDSIRDSKDATTGAKFKPLARKTIAARAMMKGKYAKDNVPLALTGKLYEVATGRRIRNAGGNASSGNVQKDGIRLQQRVNYQPGEARMGIHKSLITSVRAVRIKASQCHLKLRYQLDHLFLSLQTVSSRSGKLK